MEFKKYESLALIQPKHHETTIFRIDTYCYVVEDSLKGGYYELHLKHSSYHNSLDEIEKMILSIKNRIENDDLKIYCHFVYEFPLDTNIHFNKYLSIRRYDEKGILSEKSLCSYNLDDSDLSEFRGRSKDLIKFKVGDFVEVLMIGDNVTPTVGPALITALPKSINECWEIKQQLPNGFTLNWLDDYYRIIDKPINVMWTDRIHPVFVCKPRNELPDEIKEKLNQYINEYYNNTRIPYCREGGSEKDLMALIVCGLGKDFIHDGPILKPEDFLPIYNAKEVKHISLQFNNDSSQLFDLLTQTISNMRTKSNETYNGFIINIMEPDRKDKYLNMCSISKWRKNIIKTNLNINDLTIRKMIVPENKEYQIEILAYKL